MNIWFAFISWPLSVVLLRTLGFMYFFELVFLFFFLDMYPGVLLMDHMVVLFLAF